MKKTRAQRLGITKFPYFEYDKDGNKTYYENGSGYWSVREHDGNGMLTYLETSRGDWSGIKYDKQGERVYWENFNGVRVCYI
tara:strand:- start:4809 stop:5054 length:246 start_codon:yes stop_codon:yes gene_type:complete